MSRLGIAKRNPIVSLLSILLVVLPIWACANQETPMNPDLSASQAKSEGLEDQEDPHASLMKERFPSASTCRACHPNHYRQWSSSAHAYAQLSPVFNAMQGTINKKMHGTLGDFCIRCHTPVGMTIKEPLFTSNINRHPLSVEGITCIACHRMNKEVGKVSGRRPLVQASILEPVYGPSGGSEVKKVIADGDFGVVTESGKPGRAIHRDAHQMTQLSQPGFCGSCHDVNLPNGFRLEEAFSEFKASPAARRGETCQDCHMGKEPGISSGYDFGPAAIVGGKKTRDRKLTNHTFSGPDYSIVHPGIFPHNPVAQEMASMAEWLQFDHKAGWGTDEFEDAVSDDATFPEKWESADDRYEAREIIDEQLLLLEEVNQRRLALLKRGYLLSEILVDRKNQTGLAFHLEIKNGTDGHNVPTGFTAERLVFLEVTVLDPQGNVVFRSGDLDPNGDVRDAHSIYVHNGELPVDEQLFSLQSKFITLNVRGGEREQVLAVNESVDSLPFLRTSTMPTTLTGRPLSARIHKRSIEPGGVKQAHYKLTSDQMRGPGDYTVRVRLKSAMVPVNLVAAVAGVGFDYGLSPRAVADRVVEGHVLLWERNTKIHVQ